MRNSLMNLREKGIFPLYGYLEGSFQNVMEENVASIEQTHAYNPVSICLDRTAMSMDSMVLKRS